MSGPIHFELLAQISGNICQIEFAFVCWVLNYSIFIFHYTTSNRLFIIYIIYIIYQ